MKFGCYILHILCLGKGILKVMTSAQKLTLANSSLLSDFCHLNVMFVCLLPEKKTLQISPSDVIRTLSYPGLQRGSFENEALENEDRSTKHPNLEKEAPKTRKRNT